MAEIVCLTVAFVLTVTQFVVGLQVCPLPKRLAVINAHYISFVVRRCLVVSGCKICRVLPLLILYTEKVNIVVRDVSLLVIAGASFHTKCDISALGVESSIDLEHPPDVAVASVTEAGLFVFVDGKVLLMHLFYSIIIKWVS